MLELLLSWVTSSEHQDFLYQRLQTDKAGDTEKSLDLYIQLQDLEDKYALHSNLASSSISQFSRFIRGLGRDYGHFNCVLRAFTGLSKARQRPVLVACLECFEQYSRSHKAHSLNAVDFGRSWISSRIDRWSFENCQQLDPALYWMLVKTTSVKEQVGRHPSEDPAYWRYIITNLPEFPAIEQ